MYGGGIDMESSGSYRKKKDPFQSELQRKLSDRRTKGLTTDITSPEEDSEASGDDDFLSQFTTPKKRTDRPKSAKHRQPPSFLKNQRNGDWKQGLGDTMRPGAGGDIFGRYMSKDNFDDSDEEESEMTLTVGSSKSPRLQEINSQTKNHPKQGEKLSKEDIIFGRKGSSPRDSKSPRQERSKENQPWQPPSFKKTHLPEADSVNRAPSPGSSKGRKTPTMDPLLESISETPTPRSRQLSQTDERYRSEEDRDQYNRPKPKPRGRKEDVDFETTSGMSEKRRGDGHSSESFNSRKTPPISGRKTPVEDRKTPVEGRKTPVEGRKTPTISGRKSLIDTGRTPTNSERKTPTSDIFGKSGKSSSLDFLESEKEEELKEEKKTPKVTPRHMSTKSDNKSRTKSPVPAGRKTPTFNKKDNGKKTKSRSASPDERKADDDINARRASVMDFMLGDSVEQTPKPRKSRLTRANSSDSITDEIDLTNTKGHRSRPRSRGSPKLKRDPSNSSICEDIQGEPLHVDRTQDPDQAIYSSKSSSGPQRSDKQQAEEAINSVAGAQDKLGMQYIEPDKADKEKKTKKKAGPKFLATQRPKPRYPSKPGEIIDIESPSSFEDTVSIRNAIFVEWYKERAKKTKEAFIEKKKKETEEEEKKRKEREDKLLENKASYNTWMERKQSAGKDKGREKRREEETKKEKEIEEKERKKKDAMKTFNIWKEKKDSIIKSKVHKVHDEEKYKEREAAKNKRHKEKQNSTAYKSWKERKDNQIHSTIKTEKKKVEQETMSEAQLAKRKEREAEQRYELWMKKKEEHEKAEKRRQRHHKLEGEEFRPAWSPANKTIPFGR